MCMCFVFRNIEPYSQKTTNTNIPLPVGVGVDGRG